MKIDMHLENLDNFFLRILEILLRGSSDPSNVFQELYRNIQFSEGLTIKITTLFYCG